ncbi:hypothetical protein AB4O69_19490, partial [Escherichia coli]|uniref:hypothetical protein n=1 Tax=Escherichia coli TaxID=562 RepID=UPI0034C6D325
ILLRQKQKKLIMLPSETMIWQPEFTDKTLSRKPGAVQSCKVPGGLWETFVVASPASVIGGESNGN